MFFCVFILPCFQLVLAGGFCIHLCTYFAFSLFLFYIVLIWDTFCFVSDFCTVRTHFFVLFFWFFQISCSLIKMNGSWLNKSVWFLAVWVSSGHRFTLVGFALLVLFWWFLVLFWSFFYLVRCGKSLGNRWAVLMYLCGYLCHFGHFFFFSLIPFYWIRLTEMSWNVWAVWWFIG